MVLLILFAFLGGIVTILSPCILPILPIVLSGSLGGGKQRPFGVISGFILSFTFFTLFLATIVSVTGLSADALRLFSVIVVALFGISLFIPQFQILTERLFSKMSALVPIGRKGNGYWAGFLVGLSLGLVWTPCVGPILASVISLAITGSVSGTAFFITLSYAVGTAIPLLAITYGGRKLLQQVPWLLTRSGQIQKAFGVFMLLTAVGIYFNVDRTFQTYILNTFPQYGVGLTGIEDNEAVRRQLQNLQPQSSTQNSQGKTTRDMTEGGVIAPELILGGQWFNSEPLTMKSLRGKVVLIDFWTYTCINCIRTLPYLRDWHAKYADKGLVIIGVHTPEFAFEKTPTNVRQAIKDFDLKYPVMQDNNYATWRAYNNRFWPAKYFVDKNGVIRANHFGEGGYDESEKIIQQLLAEAGQSITMPIQNPAYTVESRTPELYLGYGRMEFFVSPEGVQKDIRSLYTTPTEMPASTFAYVGAWDVMREYAAPGKDSQLLLDFEAKDVYLVMRPRNTEQKGGRVRVFLDGKLVTTGAGIDVIDGITTVTKDTLYKLIHLPTAGRHTLRLEFLDGNIELFAFTFG